jgi:checkpoint serine/threonine-protein kinase
LPLIEATTRRFVSDPRFSQDLRLLRMWISYTRMVERREEIWAYLDTRNIGTNHAVFYEEWAAANEGLGRYVQIVGSRMFH